MRRLRSRSVLAVAAAAFIVGWVGAPANAATEPLTYHEVSADHRTVLADDGVRRVEVIGDLDAATRVVVLVPGVGNTRSDMIAVDPNVPVPAGRTPHTVLTQARALYDAMAAAVEPGSSERIAVIAWLGYVPPSPSLQALDTAPAQRGAENLLGLETVLAPDASVVWVCHSYGTVLCAYAAQQQAPDAMILLASPGVPIDSVAQLAAPIPVWAGRIDDDPVRWAAQLDPVAAAVGLGYRTDPTGPGFGAATIDFGATGGHSGYFTPGSTALTRVAAIASGPVPTQAGTTGGGSR